MLGISNNFMGNKILTVTENLEECITCAKNGIYYTNAFHTIPFAKNEFRNIISLLEFLIKQEKDNVSHDDC